jgi:flagellar hook-length control protein FliK
MMQHVATAKSEVAAFDSGVQSNSFKGSESNEPFGKLLQDQKSSHALAAAPETPSPHSSTQEDTINKHLKSHAASNVANQRNDKLKNGDTEAELQLVSPSKQNALESDVNEADVAAQEWVSLVDNLQKLADVARPTKQTLVDVEVQPIDIAEADLKSDSKIAESISMLVDEALGDVLKNAEEDLVDTYDRQKMAVLLLEQPRVLQDLISKLQIDSQKSGTDTSEQKTLNTAIDPVIEKEELLVNQQSELNAQVNLSFAENKALLRSLLVLEDSDIGTNPVQRPGKLANPVLPDTPEKLMQVQQTETLITKLESEAEQSELLEQDVQIAPGNLLNPGKVENVASNNDIKNILNLTDSKLDKVLENIAQRVLDSKKTDEAINSEQIAQQVIPKSADIISSVESSSKEFVSMLKSGLEEYKNQLSQGREPGIDLKALISEALAKSTESGVETKSPVNLEQIVNSVSQVLDFAKTMNRAIEHHHDQVYSANSRDAAQVQGEQSKQIQLNQFESKFEKAINISKPEGHQQLAEKVRWMVNTKNLVAEIRLDPAELGSVHIKVAVSGESATVNFLVQSQQARDAVDTATPRLKEMLAEKGIELGQSSVRQESSGQQDQGDAGSTSQGGRGNDEAEDVDVSGQVLVQHNIVNGALGGIDYFV